MPSESDARPSLSSSLTNRNKLRELVESNLQLKVQLKTDLEFEEAITYFTGNPES